MTPASGRQDHTILPSAATSLVSVLLTAHGFLRNRPAIPSRAKRCRVHRIPPRVRDDRDTPLEWDETVSDIGVIWGRRKQQYFCLWDSTAQITPNLARRAGDFFTRRLPPSRRHRKIRHVGQIRERSRGLNAAADNAAARRNPLFTSIRLIAAAKPVLQPVGEVASTRISALDRQQRRLVQSLRARGLKQPQWMHSKAWAS